MKYFFSTLLLITMVVKEAYTQNLDTELWTEVKGKYELADKLNFGFEIGFRLDENISQPKIFYVEPELEYEIVKDLDLSFSYRYSILPNSIPDKENRLAGAIAYKIDVGELNIQYRLKYQEDYIPEDDKVSVLRNRLKFDYNLSKKFDPYFLTELFYDASPTQKEFEQLRFLLGVEINLPKGKELNVFYMVRNRFNVGTPGNVNVIGLSYNLGDL